MDSKNFKITLEYDGGLFHGWQKQKNDITIQEELEKAVEKICGKKTPVTGSGRTDAGVHALGQTANFKCLTRMQPRDMQKALNSITPEGILVTGCHLESDDFHARFSATGKTYRYHILNAPLPVMIGRQYVWHIPKDLDLDKMKTAAKHLIGTHDFKSFEATGSPREHTVRTLTRAEFSECGTGRLTFEIEGNGFLRYMVRNIVGTLVEVGLSKISTDGFRDIIKMKDRTKAGATAPPQGLFLVKVDY